MQILTRSYSPEKTNIFTIIFGSNVTIAIEDNDAWSLFKILKGYIPGKQITIDDNNIWNLLKITWRAIAAADLLTTAASCCSFVAAAIWKIFCEIPRIESIMLIICSSSLPVVVVEMQ